MANELVPPDGHQVTNGLLHLGAPDVRVLRKAD